MQATRLSLVLLAAATTAVAQGVPCWDPNFGTNLGLTDETVSAGLALGFTFTYGGVGYTDIQVCDNGYVTLGPTGGQANFDPLSTTLLADPFPRICPFWVDLWPFDPLTSVGGGAVYFRTVPASGSIPAHAVITWDAVFEFLGSTPHTFQLTLIAGGGVQVAYGADLAQNFYPWLVGASPGNNATANPVSFTTLPVLTTGNPTMHEEDNNGSGSPLAGSTLQWQPDSSGGWIVVQGANCAASSLYGTGCVGEFTSFYEWFQSTPSIDLSNSAFRMFLNGSSYVVVGTTPNFIAPTAAAANLDLSDDSETTITLASALTFPGGTTTTLTVASNGRVEAASNSAAGDFTPTPGELLAFPNATWSVWRDFIPNQNAPDNVYFEEVGNLSIVTWLNVIGYVGLSPGTTPSTFQIQFDRSNGTVTFVFQSMDTVSVSTWAGGEGWVVGFSPGGASLDPGSTDLSSVLATGSIATAAADFEPLSIDADSPPAVGTSINLDIDGITPTAPFGGILLGFTKYVPGLPVPGMPSCFQYNDGLAVLLFFPAGQPEVLVPFAVPNFPGIRMQVQAALYDPTAGRTPLGATSSNGLELRFGN